MYRSKKKGIERKRNSYRFNIDGSRGERLAAKADAFEQALGDLIATSQRTGNEPVKLSQEVLLTAKALHTEVKDALRSTGHLESSTSRRRRPN